jgi:hypothetical protein
MYGPVAQNTLPAQNGDLILQIADRFERDLRAHEAWARIAKQCVEFVEGKQWTAEDLATLEEQGRPALTLNKIKPLVMLVLGYHLQNRTDFNALPGIDDTGSYACAQALSNIFKNISVRSQLPFVDGEVFMDGIIGGRGFYDTRLDFSENDFGEVKIVAQDPFSTFLDSDGDAYDLNKSSRITTSRWLSLDEVTLHYGQQAAAMVRPWLGSSGTSGMPGQIFDFGPETAPWRRFGGEDQNPENWWNGVYERFYDLVDRTRKVVRIIDMQHFVTVPRMFLIDLETGDREPIPDFWDQTKIEKVLAYAEYVGNPLRAERRMTRRVRWSQMVADTLIYDRWSPYDTFTTTPFFPYFRRGMTQGMVEPLIDAQLEVNKRRSARLNIIMRAANSGWIYDKATLDAAARENIERFGSSAGVHVAYDSRNGTLKAPQQIEPVVNPIAMKQLEQEAEDDLKKISGINDSALGQIDRVQSGRAIEARQKQTVVGLELFISNYKRSKELLGYKCLNLVQKHYTEPRVFRILGADGQPMTFKVNEKLEAANQIVNDITVGRYVIEVDDQPLSASFLEAQFAELLMLKEKGVPIPDDVLLEASSVGNKDTIKQRIMQVRMQMGLPPDVPVPLPPAGGGPAAPPDPQVAGLGPSGSSPAPSTEPGGPPNQPQAG